MKFEKLLKPLLKRLRFESFLQACFAAFAAGFAAAFLSVLLMRLFADQFIWGLIVAVTLLLAVAAGIVTYLLIYRLSYREMIRRIDAAGLQERLVTMHQLMGDKSYIARKQREDTLARLATIRPHAIPLHMPLITAAITCTMTLGSMAATLLPLRQKDVEPPAPIYDTYKVVNVVVVGLVEELYQKVEQLSPSIPSNIRDQLEEIISSINQTQNDGTEKSDTDRVSSLEEELDKIESMLEQNKVSITIGDLLKVFPNTYDLGVALTERSDSKVASALNAMKYDLIEFLEDILATVAESGADSKTKEALQTQIESTIATLKTKEYSFSEGKAEVEILKYAISAMTPAQTLSIGTLLASHASTAELGEVFSDPAEALAVITKMKETYTTSDDAEELSQLIADMNVVLSSTATSKDDETHLVLRNLYTALNTSLQYMNESDMERASIAMEEGFLTAEQKLPIAIMTERINALFRDSICEQLDKILSGVAMSEKLTAISNNLEIAFERGNFSEFTDNALIQALSYLNSALKSVSEDAIRGSNFTDKLNKELSVANKKICDALHQEKETEDALEEIKDLIEEAIEEIMKETEDKADVYVPTEEEEQEQPETDSAEPSEPNNPQEPGGGPSGGENNDLDALTFYDPFTGQEQQLTSDALAKFKENMDAILATGTYTEEQLNSMNRYYEMIAQRLG